MRDKMNVNMRGERSTPRVRIGSREFAHHCKIVRGLVLTINSRAPKE